MNRSNATGLGRATRLALVLAVGAFLFALASDPFGSIELWMAKRSVGAWLLGILALGGLHVAGEVVGDWIHRRDKTSDPLWRRSLNLLLLLAFIAVGVAIAWIVWSAVT